MAEQRENFAEPIVPLSHVSVWRVTILAALAGGMGWGIRGQYGHETGAMIPGLLVSLVLVLQFRPWISSLSVARAVAFCTAAIGFGGAMTYGQTVGLTQNESVVGNWAALGWGMTGLALKGALWIGFAGAFLGMGLSGVRYSAREIALILGGLLLLMLAGIWTLNLPFDPANRLLPQIYFSADWHWYPSAVEELKPRREVWGGFLFGLVGLVSYLGWVRRDHLARNMAFWGCVGGLGFPIGQSLQAWHAWNSHLFQAGWLARVSPFINWWNFMETTFGLVLGAALGMGLWVNRRRLAASQQPTDVIIKPGWEFFLMGIHVAALCVWDFASVSALDNVGDLGIPRSLLPLIGTAGGRYWPYFVALPIVALPILGKTANRVAVFADRQLIAFLCVSTVLILLVIAAIAFARRATTAKAHEYLRPSLVVCTWLYFGLNFAFVEFPWLWTAWTIRTPNTLIFTVCALVLTWAALRSRHDSNVPLTRE